MTRASDLAKLLGAGATILDGTTISTADNTTQLTLTSTDADANAGPELNLYRNSSSPADADLMGTLTFRGRNDNSQDVNYGQIVTRAEDASDGTEDGRVDFRAIIGGTEGTFMKYHVPSGNEVVFNDGSLDIDFRVESNGNANMLTVNGGSDLVGIGADPDLGAGLHVKLSDSGAGVSSSYDTVIIEESGHSGIQILSGTSSTGLLGFNDSGAALRGYVAYAHSSDAMEFGTSGAERVRINDKGLLINTNATLHSGVERALEVENHSASGFAAIFKGATASHETVCIHNAATSGTRILLVFKTSGSTGTLVGRVTSDGSTVDYATSSDYRLKENVEYNWDATTRLKQLKPARFNWIADEDNITVDGFIAHEVSDIVPQAITGEKDAMTEELLYVDGDEIPEGKKVGDVKEASVIDPQGIDQSKLVPLLVKTIQELEARITALESA